MKSESFIEAVKAAPPVGVGSLTLMGLPLNEWVLILTLIYTIFLIIDKLPAVWERIAAGYKKLKGRGDE